MSLHSLVYVCVVSGFNLPELESCLARRPAQVLLVVSDAFQQQAARLNGVLEQLLPGVQVRILSHATTGVALQGDEVLENQQWVQQVLLPCLNQPPLNALPRALNFTGGTKAMAAVLLHAHAWGFLDYKALNHDALQVLEPVGDGRTFAAAPAVALPAVLPQFVAALHADQVSSDPPNRILDQQPEASLALARDIWQAQEHGCPHLRALFQHLERLWVLEHDNPTYRTRRLRLDWAEFLQGPEQPAAGLLRWLERFRALDPSALDWNDQRIELPGNRPDKTHRALRQWISGLWLEQLAYHWLLEADIAPDAIARNLKCGQRQDSASQRELDLLVHRQGKTRLVEIKAGYPPGLSPGTLESQLSSIGSRFGRTEKALLLGPQPRQLLMEGKRWDTFALRCEASGICLLHSRAMLVAFICNGAAGVRKEAGNAGEN
ncbi:hypothetical protein [Pseudomonas sp. UBA6323]|uniref:hypothetical protein n=1 Tax=Pseudomonas sp. UBA6323 TaxID=1947329 RepID=UPI0025D8DB03|nr:hypothetical protein [Pseudomonas sp. UBA6323]